MMGVRRKEGTGREIKGWDDAFFYTFGDLPVDCVTTLGRLTSGQLLGKNHVIHESRGSGMVQTVSPLSRTQLEL